MVSTSTQFFLQLMYLNKTKRSKRHFQYLRYTVIEIAFRKWKRVGNFLLLSKQKTFYSKILTKFKRHTVTHTLWLSLSLLSICFNMDFSSAFWNILIFISRIIFCWNGVNRSTKRQNLRTCFPRSARPFQRPSFGTTVFLNHPSVKTVS